MIISSSRITLSHFKTCLATIFMLLGFSCNYMSQEIVEKPESKPQLAFYCELNNEYEYQRIPFISYTSNVGSPIKWNFNYGDLLSIDPPVINPVNSPYYANLIKGAKAEIYENGYLFRKFSNSPLYGEYSIVEKIKFNPEKIYTLKVFKEGFDTVVGSQLFPKDYLMDTNHVKLNVNNTNGLRYGLPKLSELVFEIDDDPKFTNAYAFNLTLFIQKDTFINGMKQKLKLEEFNLPTYIIDPNTLQGKCIGDKGFNGKKYFWHVGLNLNREAFKTTFMPSNSEKLTIVMYFRSTSPDYLKYLNSIDAINDSKSNAFAEPSSPSFNMNGGAGVFICFGKEYKIEIAVNY